jgi:hypothetical protein
MQTQLAAEASKEISWIAQLAAPQSHSPAEYSAMSTANIRAVWLIAKPERSANLGAALKGPLLGLLESAPGFAGSMVLYAHKESRSVMVLTFWGKSAQAINTCWEEFSAVRRLLSPLVDVCTKVQVYEGEITAANGLSTVRHMPASHS